MAPTGTSWDASAVDDRWKWIVETVWPWVVANGDGLAGVAAVVTGVVAVAALAQTARDSRERSRPSMVAELRIVPYTQSLELVVRNVGPAVAREMTVTFDPPFEPTEDRASTSGYIQRRYAKSFSTIAPGQTFTNIWDFNPDTDVSTVTPTTVTIKYRRGRFRRYTDQYVLDPRDFKNQTTSTSTASPDGRMKSILDEMRKLTREAQTLRRWMTRQDRGTSE